MPKWIREMEGRPVQHISGPRPEERLTGRERTATIAALGEDVEEAAARLEAAKVELADALAVVAQLRERAAEVGAGRRQKTPEMVEAGAAVSAAVRVVAEHRQNIARLDAQHRQLERERRYARGGLRYPRPTTTFFSFSPERPRTDAVVVQAAVKREGMSETGTFRARIRELLGDAT